MESARRVLFREKIADCSDSNENENRGRKRKTRSTPRKNVLMPETKNIPNENKKKISQDSKKPKIKKEIITIEIEEIHSGDDTVSEKTTSNKSDVNQIIADYSSSNQNISAELLPDKNITKAIVHKENTPDYRNDSTRMSDQQQSTLQQDENSTEEFIDVENITDPNQISAKDNDNDNDNDPLQETIQELMTENEIEIVRKSLEEENTEGKSINEENFVIFNNATDSEPGTSFGREEDTSTVNLERHDRRTVNDNLSTIDDNNDAELDNNEDAEILPAEEGENETCENEKIENSNVEDNENILDTSKGGKTKTKPKRKVRMSKSYVDFLSESEDFEWDSTSWKDSEAVSSNDDNQEPKQKKKKKSKKKIKPAVQNQTNETEENNVEETVGERGLRKKKCNKRKIRQQLRNSGDEYLTNKGKIIEQKTIKPNPCLGKKCRNDCGDIDEEKRKRLFDHFYSLSLQRKKDWIVSLARRANIKRKRSRDSGVRCNSYEYFINEGEGKRQVCAQFLQNTLDISHKYLYYTVSNASLGTSKEDMRGKTVPPNKIDENTKSGVRDFIKSLPALPSHYCRKNTEKLYLPVEYKNIKNLYRIYKEDKSSRQEAVVGEKTFRNIFNEEFNIGFHIPKKDKCVKCIRFEVDKSEEAIEAKREHLQEKRASKDRHECHRDIAKQNPSILCASFDLQKVLNTPYGKDLVLFYSRKYAVYNLCIYESGTREGFCYIWGESEGKRGANEIASILQRYILQVDARGTIKHLVLYSDSCPGQNKNRTILAVVHHTLTQCDNLESIQLNYLLPGHTEMPVDSMHSTIEGSVKNTTIWAPSQWMTVCQIARKELAPYNVTWLDHTNFNGYDEFADKYFKGNLTGKISKIRVATFKKSTPHKMTVRYSMKTDAEEETIIVATSSGKGNKAINDQLYKSSLPISKPKYNDLKKLCDNATIPRIFQAEYKNLQCGNVKDHLVDTDLEDETDEE